MVSSLPLAEVQSGRAMCTLQSFNQAALLSKIVTKALASRTECWHGCARVALSRMWHAPIRLGTVVEFEVLCIVLVESL